MALQDGANIQGGVRSGETAVCWRLYRESTLGLWAVALSRMNRELKTLTMVPVPPRTPEDRAPPDFVMVD